MVTSVMSSSSVSFRISRHTQDLAETVHALSQRLVSMEQRLEVLEGHLQALRQQPRLAEQEEAASLAPIEAHIERLLQDCRQLLADQPSGSSQIAVMADPLDAADPVLRDGREAPDGQADARGAERVESPAPEDPDEEALEAARAA